MEAMIKLSLIVIAVIIGVAASPTPKGKCVNCFGEIVDSGTVWGNCTTECKCKWDSDIRCENSPACHEKATCEVNRLGKHKCICTSNYEGDGRRCTLKQCDGPEGALRVDQRYESCEKKCICALGGELQCGKKADCSKYAVCGEETKFECRCQSGYHGNGYDCSKEKCDVSDIIPGIDPIEEGSDFETCEKSCRCKTNGKLECVAKAPCPENSHCNEENGIECVCDKEFEKDGEECRSLNCDGDIKVKGTGMLTPGQWVETCDETCTCQEGGGLECEARPDCSPDGSCGPDTQYKCKCDEGYSGDGYRCKANSCNGDDIVDGVGQIEIGENVENCEKNCTCNDGGRFSCIKKVVCSKKSTCSAETGFSCVCKEGYAGDGYDCKKVQCKVDDDESNTYNVKVSNSFQTCSKDCECLPGGQLECKERAPCSEDASCGKTTDYKCVCEDGFSGDGYECIATQCTSEVETPLNVGDNIINCKQNCTCEKGDNLICLEKIKCDTNAECGEQTGYHCRCKAPHWQGDGVDCKEVDYCIGDGYIVGKGSTYQNCNHVCFCTENLELQCTPKDPCHEHALCSVETLFQCVCKEGYGGDGVECKSSREADED